MTIILDTHDITSAQRRQHIGRHRDVAGNRQRDVEDASRAAKTTLAGAASGLVVVAGGIVVNAPDVVTSGSWMTIVAGAAGAVLLWVENWTAKRAARSKGDGLRGGDDAARGAGSEDPSLVQKYGGGGHSIPTRPATVLDSWNDDVAGERVRRTLAPVPVAEPTADERFEVPVRRGPSCLRSRGGVTARNRFAMVRYQVATPVKDGRLVTVNARDFLTEGRIRMARQ